MSLDENKISKLDLVGGLLVIILGATHIILAFLLGQLGYYRDLLIPAVYGSIFLPGGLIFFIVSMKERFTIKKFIINTSSILLLMSAISNLIQLITLNVGTQTYLYGLFFFHITLCSITLPMTFIRYAFIEKMDNKEKLKNFSIILLRGSGIFHILQPIIYAPSLETLGMVIFGILFLLITVLLIRKKENKGIQLIGFILPLINAILGIGILFMNPTPYLIVFIIFDFFIFYFLLFLFTLKHNK